MAELTYFRTRQKCPHCAHDDTVWIRSKLGSRGATYEVGDGPEADIPAVDFEDTSFRVQQPGRETRVLLSSTCESCRLENFAEVVFADGYVRSVELVVLDPTVLQRLHYIGEMLEDMLETIIGEPLRNEAGLRNDWLEKLRAALDRGNRW